MRNCISNVDRVEGDTGKGGLRYNLYGTNTSTYANTSSIMLI